MGKSFIMIIGGGIVCLAVFFIFSGSPFKDSVSNGNTPNVIQPSVNSQSLNIADPLPANQNSNQKNVSSSDLSRQAPNDQSTSLPEHTPNLLPVQSKSQAQSFLEHNTNSSTNSH